MAEIFGVRTATVARWTRDGTLEAVRTPGGHRRYRRTIVNALRAELIAIEQPSQEQERFEEDAVRLYNQGWSIRQVGEKFGCSYGAMRRILKKHTTLRTRIGA